MNRVEGTIQGFTSNGKAAIIDGVSYGAYDPSFWKGAEEGDKVSFMWQPSQDKKWKNVVPGSVTRYKVDKGEYSKDDILAARRVALPVSVLVKGDWHTNAEEMVAYLLGQDMGQKQKQLEKTIDSAFDFDADVPQ